jgi:integrase/recombinase XerC
MRACRQDLDAISSLIVDSDNDISAMSLGIITTEAMRRALAQYAQTDEAASI